MVEMHYCCPFSPTNFDHMDTDRIVKSSKDLSPQILPANHFSEQQGPTEGMLKWMLFFANHPLAVSWVLLYFLMIQRIDAVANLLPAESC